MIKMDSKTSILEMDGSIVQLKGKTTATLSIPSRRPSHTPVTVTVADKDSQTESYEYICTKPCTGIKTPVLSDSDGMKVTFSDNTNDKCRTALRSSRKMSRQNAIDTLEEENPYNLPQDTLEEKVTRYMKRENNSNSCEEVQPRQPVSATNSNNIQSTDTLQIPAGNKLHRCDSGNESDIHHSHLSSGNVSPACSDYGGSRTDDVELLSRKHSKDSAIDGESSTSTSIDTDRHEFTTPVVKVWPVNNNNQTSMNNVDNDWLHEDSETLSDISQHSRADTLHRQNSEEQIKTVSKPSIVTLHRKLSDSISNSSSTSYTSSKADKSHDLSCDHLQQIVDKELLISRPSVDSLCSMDNYFSHIDIDMNHTDISTQTSIIDPSEISNLDLEPRQYHHHLLQHCNTYPTLTSVSRPQSFLQHQASCNSVRLKSPHLSNHSNSLPETETDGLAPLPSEAASRRSDGAKPLPKKKPFRERLSERTLTLNIGLREEISNEFSAQPATAPVGEDTIDRLYEAYLPPPDSSLSTLHTPATPYLANIRDTPSRWKAIKGIMPFMDKCKRQKFVQLAGHQGSFETSSEDNTVILKKFCQIEHAAFTKLFGDPLHKYIPAYHGTVLKDGLKYCQLENLLHSFVLPSVMDCKIGVRTYLEDELTKAEKSPTPRKDMYEKMVKVDPSEPTDEEHKNKAISKPRYMQWREQISSTATMSFRIEGIKCADGSSCVNFKTSRDQITIKTIISGFTNNDPDIIRQYVHRLKDLRNVLLQQSKFFWAHEVIGSSLLFVHDKVKASVWMIDFGKTVPLPEGCKIKHNVPWTRGNHEDGYLTGLDNLTSLLEELLIDCETRLLEQHS